MRKSQHSASRVVPHGTRPFVRDGRRRRVPAVSLRDFARDPSGADTRRADVAKRLKKQTREVAWTLAGTYGFWICIVAILWSKLEDRLIGRHTFQGLPRAAAIGAVLAAAIFGFWWLAARQSRLKRVRVVVKARFCGSCGYDLQNLAPAADGLTVCPECGSAWRR
jgi:hypothetical protein